MALTLSQQRTMLGEFLAYDLDNYKGEAPTAAELTAQINFAIRFASRAIRQFDPSVVITLANGTMSYDLRNTSIVSRKVIEVKGVIINGNPLYAASGRRYGLYSLSELDAERPTWRTASSGTPTRAMQLDQTLYLIDKPNATIAAATNYVAGVVMAKDMTSGADDNNYCELPEELHEAVVRIAADFAADPNVTEAEGLSRLARYTGKAGMDLDEVRNRNVRLAAAWGSTGGRYQSNYVAV